jgi:phosphatidate cytidylyltransferase
MPLNKEVFKVRAISAVFFVIVMLTGLLWNVWSFLLLFLIIHAGCWWEYVKLVEKIEQVTIHIWARLGFIAAGMALMLAFCGDVYSIGNYRLKDNLVLPLSAAGFILMAMGILHKYTRVTATGFARLLIGFAYISLSWGMMLWLRQSGITRLMGDLGWILPLILIGSIWVNDTMAYIVGSFIGKTPLSPISPKKTWEGTIGGAVLAVVVVALIAKFAFNTGWLYAIVIPFLGAVFGTLGDLIESKLKRMAGVKDSGSMMPGHGGFLDRFDSMLLATPAVWLFMFLSDL